MTEAVDPSAIAPPSKPPRKAMLIVFLVVFIDLLGFGIVLPLLPRYADVYLINLGLPEYAKGIVIGVLMSSFSAMQFIFAPIWGRVSDRVGRRPILILGLAGSVVSYGAVWPRFFEFVAARRLDAVDPDFADPDWGGDFGATISTAAAVIADCTPKESARTVWP